MSAIELPDQLAARLAAVAAERGMTAGKLALEVLTERFGPRRLSFTAVGRSGNARGGAEAEQLLSVAGVDDYGLPDSWRTAVYMATSEKQTCDSLLL